MRAGKKKIQNSFSRFELKLTVVIIIVDDHRRRFVQSHIVSAVSFEHWADLLCADVVEVHHNHSVAVLCLDFLLESWEDEIRFDSQTDELRLHSP